MNQLQSHARSTMPLQCLQPPKANPRSVFDGDTIEGLAQSIAQDGLLQNLVVAPGRSQKGEGKRFRIISGERRYRALKLLEERGTIKGDFPVPVEVRAKLTDDDKLRLATIENVQRENLPPLDEAAALAALIRKGVSLDDLCAKTGLSVTTIRRRLVLNDLCEEAKTCLRDGEITLSQAEALTLGSEEQQRDMLADCCDDLTAAEIREHMIDDRPSVAVAIFPLVQYQGTLTTDLFAQAETSYFDDAEQFALLQRQAAEQLVADFATKAAWAELTERYSAPVWQYGKAEDGEQGGVIVNLSPSGRVEIHEGLIRPKIDKDTADAIAGHPIAPKKPKPAYSAPLCRLIAWHKSIAVQELLLSSPRKAKEISVTERLVSLKPHQAITGLSGADEPGMSFDIVEMQARLCAQWLGLAIDDDEPFWQQFPPRFADERSLYEAVCALSDHQLEQLDTLVSALRFGQENCDKLDTQDSLFNRVARDLGTAMRDHWKPDRAFLEKRTRDQLLEIAGACGLTDLYGTGLLRSYKKSELAGCLARHFDQAQSAAAPNDAQRKAREWLPEAMLFPAVEAADDIG